MSTYDPPADRSTKVPHLVLALLFLGIAAGWGLVVTGVLTPDALPYAVPALLVTAGVGGLVAIAVGNRRRPDPTTSAPVLDDRADGTVEGPDDLEHTAPLYRPEDNR